MVKLGILREVIHERQDCRAIKQQALALTGVGHIAKLMRGNAQRSQLLTVMADAVSECRTATDQAAELNETGQVGLLRLAEIWSAIRAKEGMGGLILEGTEAKILSDVVAQFYAYLSGCMFNDPVGMAIYAELHYMMSSLMLGEWFE